MYMEIHISWEKNTKITVTMHADGPTISWFWVSKSDQRRQRSVHWQKAKLLLTGNSCYPNSKCTNHSFTCKPNIPANINPQTSIGSSEGKRGGDFGFCSVFEPWLCWCSYGAQCQVIHGINWRPPIKVSGWISLRKSHHSKILSLFCSTSKLVERLGYST